MQIGGWQGQKGVGNGEQLLKGHSISFWGDENVLELEEGDGCMTL